MKRKKLTKLFKALGAVDPEEWADSQVDEGIPQLARYMFLRQAWRNIVSEDNTDWITNTIEAYREAPDEPYAGVGRALESLRAKGATDAELTDLVRGTQAESLFSFCHLLEDPGDLGPAEGHVEWALYRVDDEGNAIEPIPGLHESVLETDPTGREMWPLPDRNPHLEE